MVVGAGIAGLATAAALQRRGLDVTVLEERADTHTGAGISIWPNALAALDEIGLGDDVRAAGGQVTAGAMRWRDGAWLRKPQTDRIVDALGEPLVVIRRAALTDILTDAVAPGSVRSGVAVTAVTVGDGARVALADGSHVDADAVVGADGTHSLVARELNGPLSHSYAGYTAWRGVAEVAIDGDYAGQTLGPGVEFGHVPMGADRTYWFAVERTDEGGRRDEGELEYLRQKHADWATPVPDVLAATDPAGVLRHDIYDRAPAKVWAQGRAVLVGDAAHPMRPHLGQGGCQALEDAAILAAFVGADGDLPGAFERFADYRRPRATRLVRESAQIGRVINLKSAGLSAALTWASGVLPEALVTRHLASIASRAAFALPTAEELR